MPKKASNTSPLAVESVLIPVELRDRFRRYCKMNGLTKAEVLQYLIEFFLSDEV